MEGLPSELAAMSATPDMHQLQQILQQQQQHQLLQQASPLTHTQPVQSQLSPLAPNTAPEMLPAPECSHEEAISSPEILHSTLKRVHECLRISEKVPRVGGRELDLYTLYKNVTSLGGCERVISRKQWRDAAESFQFPETITSVSYVLRKAYITFLWDYEQIYFLRMQGPRIPPPASQREGSSDAGGSRQAAGGGQAGGQAGGRGKKRKTSDVVATSFVGLLAGSPTQLVATSRNPGQPDAMLVGAKGQVTLDSRFDAGYFVTVRVGRQEFSGMLYYPPPEQTMHMPQEKGRDPNAPKPNKTPFNFFSVDARIKAKDAFPEMSQTDITKKVGEMWQKASEEEKAPYIAMSNQDKNRYQAELEAYNYRLAAQAAAQQAGEALQAVTTAQNAMANQPLTVAGETYASRQSQQYPMEEGDEMEQGHRDIYKTSGV